MLAFLTGCGDRTSAPPDADIAPTITSVRIEPTSPRAGERLTCHWEGFTTAEDGEDRSTVQWFRNGEPVGAGKTWWGEIRHRDQVRCIVTPSDGEEEGPPLSAETVVANSPPFLGYASVVPLVPSAENAVLTCLTGGASDADGEPVSVDIAWTVDGVDAGTGATLSGPFRHGQKIECTATPHDGTEAGHTVTSSLTIGNRPPSIESVRITPPEPRKGDTLLCEAVEVFDADQDPVEVHFTWYRAGWAVGFGPEYAGDFVFKDEVTCVAAANDGKDEGRRATATVQIANSPPHLRRHRRPPRARRFRRGPARLRRRRP